MTGLIRQRYRARAGDRSEEEGSTPEPFIRK